jgi:hypothetical protein
MEVAVAGPTLLSRGRFAARWGEVVREFGGGRAPGVFGGLGDVGWGSRVRAED